MSEPSRAELQRRDREWLCIESSDAQFNHAFAAAKRAVDPGDADFATLIALGEWKRAHANLQQPPELPAAPDSIITRAAYEILGYQPDPEKGRLRLRPDFPAEWVAVTVENLRVGDALVTLAYQRSATALSFEIEQVAGAMPVRLIFEPVLKEKFDAVRIDNQPAELDIAVAGNAVIAPVQLMLDARRTVTFIQQKIRPSAGG